MAVNFLIKHQSTGKFFHPKGGSSNPGNTTPIVLHSDQHQNMYWTFEKVTDYWGYIKHVSSGKIIHPSGGSLNPGNTTNLVLHSDRHFGALFALDEANHHVIHKGGRFAHPKGGKPDPGNTTQVVLHSDVHDAMKFLFVSTSDPNKEVQVYGKPTVVGKWKIINMVLNPMAEHTEEFKITIGRSKTESTTSSFKYRWETSAEATVDIFKASVTQSLEYMLEKSSSATWSEETTQTRTIKVSPGKSVVTWQFVFDAEQNSTRALFQSNLLADTESETEEPRELQRKLYTL